MMEEPTRDERAEDRTILANERTVDGWMRISLGCAAIGAGFQALFTSMEPADNRLGVEHLLDGADQRLVGCPRRSVCAIIRRVSILDLLTLNVVKRVTSLSIPAFLAYLNKAIDSQPRSGMHRRSRQGKLSR